MKTPRPNIFSFLLFTLLVCGGNELRAQGTAFTYQGRLTDNAGPANGSYDLRFILFDVDQFGFPVGPLLTKANVAVSGGLFTVTLDFGTNVFTGAPRWLEIGVRSNGAGAFTIILPRQLITPAPYAIAAGSVTGLVPDAQLSANVARLNGNQTFGGQVQFSNATGSFSGNFSGNGVGLTNVDATTLGGVAHSNYWRIGGNTGIAANWYLGTLDYQPLELRVNNARAIRIEPATNGWPNLIGGAPNNYIEADVSGAIVAGGVLNGIKGTSGGVAVGGGRNNLVGTNSAGSVIGGGQWNQLGDGSVRSVISGGYSNRIRGFDSTNAPAVARDITDGTSNTLLLGETVGNATIGGGYANTIGFDCVAAVIGGGMWNSLGDGSVRSFIGGGLLNTITDGTANTILAGEQNQIGGGNYSTIGGGFGNTNSGAYSVVPGGRRNAALGDYSYASGRRARANHPGSFVWADAQDADFLSTSNHQFNVRASGGVRFVTVGAGMTLDGESVLAGTVGASQLCGSYTKAVSFDHGGNAFAGSFNGNGTGLSNVNASTLGGLVASNFWRLGGNAGTTNTLLGTTDNRPLEFRVNNQRAFRVEPDGISPNLIGGRFNYATNIFFQNAARGTVIGGGGQSTLPNVVQDDFGVIVGGSGNTNNGDSSFMGAGIRNYVEDRNNVLVGGLRNSLDGRQCFLGAGETNRILSIAIDSVLVGGSNNAVRADFATLGGGANNVIDSGSDFGTVIGGANNRIGFGILYGTIPGGFSNFVDGDYAFAAGGRARAVHDGAFVWADATDANFASTGANQFLVRASGGMGLNVAQPRGELHVGNSSNAAPLNAASQTIIIENAADNGRATFLALAGPGASSSTNRVELELEANENERRAIIGTTSNHEIQFRHNNGVRVTIWTNGFVGIGNTPPTNRLMVVNARCDGSSWINSSDRNLKENFAPVNTKAVLEKVTALPLTRWNYKADPGTTHLGPVAQDFKAGFGLGADDTSIATVDADGVALAAIQGLNEKVEAGRQKSEDRIQKLEAENAELKQRLAALEKIIHYNQSNQPE